MKERELHARLAGAGIAGVGDLEEQAHDPFVTVEADALVEVLTFLRDDPECGMEMLHNVTAVERADCIELVYHLCSLGAHHSLTIKVTCDRPEGGGHDSWHPQVPSVAGVFRSADWHEREQWDLLGVRFIGHPDPRRILLPEEWIGHPLRKDYVYPTEHDGVPLELDATPMYERGGDAPAAGSGPREPGSPLPQGATPASRRPDAGGRAPAPEPKGKD